MGEARIHGCRHFTIAVASAVAVATTVAVISTVAVATTAGEVTVVMRMVAVVNNEVTDLTRHDAAHIAVAGAGKPAVSWARQVDVHRAFFHVCARPHGLGGRLAAW